MSSLEPEDRGQRWERALTLELAPSATQPDGGAGRTANLLCRDGTWAIDVKRSIQGARDLQAGVLSLAMHAAGASHLQRAVLVASAPRMTTERIVDEWIHAAAVIRPDVAARLALVALTPAGDVSVPPNDPDLMRLAVAARRAFDATSRPIRKPGAAPWSTKTFEVWKVLLGAWLRAEPALPLHEVQRRAGTSYPTVANVLRGLDASGELTRASNRSVVLSGLPRRSLGELVALGSSVRDTHWFHDRTGRPADSVALSRRIASRLGDHAALGGVEAARHYMPSFDLNGLPRLDVSVTASTDVLAWIKTIDPALAPTPGGPRGRASLVVHRVERPDVGFERSGGVTFADPAEVLLDLHELRLVEQADEFVRSLRARTAA